MQMTSFKATKFDSNQLKGPSIINKTMGSTLDKQSREQRAESPAKGHPHWTMPSNVGPFSRLLEDTVKQEKVIPQPRNATSPHIPFTGATHLAHGEQERRNEPEGEVTSQESPFFSVLPIKEPTHEMTLSKS